MIVHTLRTAYSSSIKTPFERNLLLFFIFFAGVFFIFAIIGGFKRYSPVPYWDMWGAYLDFYVQASSGHWEVWWSQHNEHRILLSRILFWIDLRVFNGQTPFLLIVNYFLAGCSFLIFYAALKEMLKDESQRYPRIILSLIVFCLTFSWLQSENFAWAFQSQFFLAQILPLLAFYLLHKASDDNRLTNRFFILAAVTGVVSLGSMANGITTLPLMTLLAMILKMGVQRISLLLFLSILGVFGYFYDYHNISTHGSVYNALAGHPLSVLDYTFTYLGGPFYFIALMTSYAIAPIAGFFLMVNAAIFTWHALKCPKQNSLQLSLLTFLLSVGGTALGTGCGRFIFGTQFFTSRYMTPALMAWTALLILFAPMIAKQYTISPYRLLPLILIPILLFPMQFTALQSHDKKLFDQMIAALAMELRVPDPEYTPLTTESTGGALSFSAIPAEQNLSIFAHPLIKDVSLQMGQTNTDLSSIVCVGAIDTIIPIEPSNHESPNYSRITGWLFNPQAKQIPQALQILDKNRTIIGYAITGSNSPAAAKTIDGLDAQQAGFTGYIHSTATTRPIRLKGLTPDCELPITHRAP